MLKNIATAHSECTTKYENKASHNAGYIVLDLIGFFGDDWKEIRKQTKKRNIYIFEKYCTFFPWISLTPYGKIMFWQFVFPTKVESKRGLIKHTFRIEATSVSLFWGGMFPNWVITFLLKLRNWN